jgi:pimeloyl-ACP methyl ester carboxylesterase
MTALGAEYDFAAALRRLTGSVLVIDGDRSKLPLEATRYWVRHAGNARLLLLANSGHRTWIDRPEALVAAIDIFLRGDWPPRAQKISQE